MNVITFDHMKAKESVTSSYDAPCIFLKYNYAKTPSFKVSVNFKQGLLWGIMLTELAI